ncbi:hypothetical protein Tco_1494980 [Tanacetum coccineum]
MKRSFQGIHRPLLPAMLTIDAGQPQPSAAPTPSQPVPTPSPSHVQITPPPISQPPPTLTQPVQSTSPPPQPSSVQPTSSPPPIQPVQSTSPPPQPSSVQPTSSPPPIQPVQPTSSPPITTIPDTQPTLPPSPQIPSPSYHDTEGPSFEPSYHMSPPPSHEPEIQTSRPSEESEQLRILLDLVPRLESRVESLEKELSDTKQTLGTAVLKLLKKVKKLENKLRQKRKREETEDEEDAEGQDQDIPSPTDQGNKFATPEKSKGSGEAQEEQISPSTLEAAQILTNVASERFKGSQAPLGSKIYRRKPKSTPTPTKILDFEEPAESQVNTASTAVNTGGTPSAQVNTAEVKTAEKINAAGEEVNTASEVNTGSIKLNTELYRIVMNRYGVDGPEDKLEKGFWKCLRIMFEEPLSTDSIWSEIGQQKIISWRYYDTCRVHCLNLESMDVYMLSERKYPLSAELKKYDELQSEFGDQEAALVAHKLAVKK